MNAPGFWDDQATAARVSADHARVSRRLEGYRTLQRDYEDARELTELGEAEDEIATSLRPLRRELERLQEAALFDGEYDGGDAVVTLQSGTGGTDAQDWAEIMLRMYERWAAERGFGVELLEASTPTGSSRPSVGSTGSCARAPSTRPTGATPRSRR
jgi:peptide chain release factor 2